MNEDYCEICSEDNNTKLVYKLPCGHSFHYECIQKSFQYDRTRTNQCPACRNPSGLIPLVNGISCLIPGIHYYGQIIPEYSVTMCQSILKSGKRKGEECNCKPMLGFTVCKRHHQINLKKQIKKTKNNKLGDDLEQVQVDQLVEITA